jgi:glycosyltransferase involved in cell wall biosynthesis
VLLVGSYLWHAKFLNALWLIREVWPTVLDRFPNARLEIVGKGAGRLTRYVRDLGTVQVHADVPDIGPYLHEATIFVNPERQRGGIKLKTLDAASFGLPIVSTAAGVEGTGLADDSSCIVANDADGFARGILRLIVDPQLGRDLGSAARGVMREHFSERALDERVAELLRDIGPAAQTAA